MAEDTAISVEHVSKNFILPHEKTDSIKSIFTNLYKSKDKLSEAQHALEDISFEIKKGEFFGIVGRNGSGKSTMLKILAGIYQPTEGKVSSVGKLVPFIELGVGFNPELTGRENVYLNGAMLGFSRKHVDAMYDDIVEFAELKRFMDQKLKNYSSGMQVRLAFSMATRSEADILLVDEVLAVGDADFQRKCFDYFKQLKKQHKTVVFVSHDMNAIREYCDRAVLIEKSKLILAGKSSKVATAYARMFLEDRTGRDGKKSGTAGRWGDETIKFQSIKSSVVGDQIKINAMAKVNGKVDKFLYGIHIVGPDGKEITATNNRLIAAADVMDVKDGDSVTFNWSVLNIFNDGSYGVTLTLVAANGDVFDWYENATIFRVFREERSTTAVLPPMHVKAIVSTKEEAA